ncbi:MAG: hypothetical protein ACT4QG_05580 [Sporichthyaceae bacterium]
MPSHLHETLVAMFRHRPALAADLLGGTLGRAVPRDRPAFLGSADVAELRPAAHRADALVLLGDPAVPDLAVLVEVQLRRDESKRWVWPEYVASTRRRLRCPTALLVICTDRATANWATTPLTLDDGPSQVVPVVLGPDAIPAVVEPADAARTPELAVLSALAHVRDPGPYDALDTLAAALDHAPVEHAVEYARLVLAELPAMARRYLENLMAAETFHYESDFTRALEAKGEAKGEARGRATMVLRILTNRAVPITDEARDRIASCTDLDQLDAWGDRAFVVETVEDLFA